LIYSTFAILAAYVMGAVWGAGNETMRLAAGAAHGSAFQEAATGSWRTRPGRRVSFPLRSFSEAFAIGSSPRVDAEAVYRNGDRPISRKERIS
jgi:hypothetical protein